MIRRAVLRPRLSLGLLFVRSSLLLAAFLVMAAGREGRGAPPLAAPPSGASTSAAAWVSASRDGGTAAAAERPRSVKVQIVADPPQKAHVYWGVKDLGLAPLEIERPRGSGPLDLILRAPGFLVVHTRAFTEHDDKVVVHLIAAPVPPSAGVAAGNAGSSMKASAAVKPPVRATSTSAASSKK